MIIYTSPTCNKCNMLKTQMKNKGIEFEEKEDVAFLLEKGFTSLPVIYDNGEYYSFSDAWEKYGLGGK